MAGPDATAAATLRRHDPDRYIATLYAPAPLRPALWAVFGFAAEVAQVPTLVSQSALGEIRLQWWRDTVNELSGQNGNTAPASGHPIADALGPVIKAHGIITPWLQSIIDGRQADLYNDVMENMPALEAYFGANLSLPMRVAIYLLAPQTDERRAADAAGHGGVALGLTRMASHLSGVAERRPELIPLDILEARGLTVAGLRSGAKAQAAIRSDLQAAAQKHFKSAVAAAADLPKLALPALLPLAPLRGDFRLLAARGHRRKEPVRRGALYRQWVMWRAARRGALR